jgi:DNA-binding beta-propeller fold protein YncE
VAVENANSEEKVRRLTTLVLVFFCAFALKANGADTAPLKLVARYEFPADVDSRFDHLIVDLKGHRLFTTPHKSVDVFDLDTGKLIHRITEVEVPHALLYRQDLQRLYVTDGEPGALKIFDGKTYSLIKSVPLLPDADAIAYDPASNYLYIYNGGKDAKMTYSTISIVDTTRGEIVGDIKVDGDQLETMVLESSSPKMYVNNRAKNQVDVIDRNARKAVASWPVTLGKGNDPIALDELNHRLFVVCRSGQLVIFDTSTGAELQALPVGEFVDDLVFDAKSKRLYAPSGVAGTIDVYEQIDANHYRSLGKVPSGPWGKTGRLVPELKRYFVPVPKNETKNAEVLVYEVQ